jgi:tetratricopeptide (TPR) repeat protein
MIRPPTTRLSPVTALAAICVAFIVACSSQPTKSPQANGQVTIADLPSRPIAATKIEQGSNGREKAILGYRRFLEQYPQSPKYDTIARRLADLLVESAADRQVDESAGRAEVLPVDDVVQKRYADAIAIYDRLLEKHPADQQTPELLYQLSRAYEATGQTELGLKVIDRLLNGEPQQHERLYADAQFRRGELLFTQGAYVEAAGAYAAVVELGESVSNYEQALYKLGWSQFKAQRYDAALAAFFMLLDRKLPAVDSDAQPATLSRAQQEQLDDVFRAVSMSFSLQGGVKSVDAYFRRNGRPSYQDQVYLKLAEFYVARDQISEASRTWLALAEVAPSSPEAPRLYVRAIELYEKAGFQQRVVETETAFVERFGVDSDFWKHHSPQDYAEIKTQIQSRLIHLAHYYHARAQRDHEPDDYREATRWYRAFLKDFADAQRAAEMNFRLAELLYEQGEYRQAIEEYKRTTWLRGDHVWKAEAGKAMLHAYAEYLKRAGDTDRYTVRKEATANAVRFTAAYPDDPASVAILAQTGVDLLDRKAYQEAIRVSEQFLEQEASLPPALMQTAWSIRAQAEYGQGDYKAAEYAYNRALQLADRNDPRWTALNTGRAAAIYKQATVPRLQRCISERQMPHPIPPFIPTLSTMLRPPCWLSKPGMMPRTHWSSSAQIIPSTRCR